MPTSVESTSTPISAGGYTYQPDDPHDAADFDGYTPRELWQVEEDGYDMSAHRAYRPMAGSDLRELVDDLDLPEHVHAQVHTGRDVATGGELAYVAVWADRTYSTCPQCGQPVAVEVDCPMGLDSGSPGGRMLPSSQQHGCGQWLPVTSCELDRPTLPQVRQAAADVAAEYAAELDAERQYIRSRLVADLRHALATPAEAGETRDEWAERITTGSEVEPGVYHDGDQWVAWDYEPVTETGDPITIAEEDL